MECFLRGPLRVSCAAHDGTAVLECCSICIPCRWCVMRLLQVGDLRTLVGFFQENGILSSSLEFRCEVPFVGLCCCWLYWCHYPLIGNRFDICAVLCSGHLTRAPSVVTDSQPQNSVEENAKKEVGLREIRGDAVQLEKQRRV